MLAVLRSDQSRILVGSAEIAPIMKQAIVAVEDRRFWEHRGVDLRGIFRAIWSDIRNQEVIQGGSTITQQLVKNTYIKPERTVSRKLKEAALAWQLERRWSKDRILTTYMNTIYFGNGAYGIEMAAKVYFKKHAKRPDASRGGTARRPACEPDRLRPGLEPDAGARTAKHGARAHVRAGADHEGAVRRRGDGRRCRAPRTYACPGRAALRSTSPST